MTDRYAVVGNPVAHSKSPQIHAEFARQTKQDLVYTHLLAPIDGFARTVTTFENDGGRGLNITLPFKAEAFQLATECSERAQLAQAVNTLRFDGKKIFGDNTDGLGLVTDIRHNLKFSIKGKRLLLMGAGGAARGVILPLLQEQPAELVVVNRTLGKAKELAQHFSHYGAISACGYADLKDRSFDVVINSTSASLANELPPLTKNVFTSACLAYDMTYGQQTPFLKFAKASGAAMIADGLGMLVEQAAESFFIWRGIRPETAPVLASFKKNS